MVKTILKNGKRAIFLCPQCKREYEGDFMPEVREALEKAVCPKCIGINNARVRNQRREEKKQALLASLDDRMAAAGFQGVFCQMENPITRHNAEFLWHNREKHLVISGETGAGKTSSAAFVMRVLMKEKKLKVCYRNWQTLHSEYVRAKMNENGSTEERFFAKINTLDYLVIDELAWRRGASKLTPAAQELLFNIIDGAYCQSRKCKVWIMGNLYGNAFEHLLDDPKPTLRRLQYRFMPVVFDGCSAPVTFDIYKEDAANGR